MPTAVLEPGKCRAWSIFDDRTVTDTLRSAEGPNPDMPRRVDDQPIGSLLTREMYAGCFP
jgi:hypothetical protein